MGRRAIVLLVALILAGLAGWAVWNYLQGIQEEEDANNAIVTVFRAGEAIAEGTDGSILVTDFNSGGTRIVEGQDQLEDIPADAIQTAEELAAVLNGKLASGPISANAILTVSQWVEISTEVTPLAELIPSGSQAMTISLDNVRGVNGFVEAGDLINLIITLDIAFDKIPEEFTGIGVNPDTTTDSTTPGQETESAVVTYTRFVMQGLPVLATGRDVRPDPDEPPTVDSGETTDSTTPDGQPVQPEEDTGNATVFTVEVTPEQAERIAYAFENGSIWMTLVPEDFVEVETQGVIIDNLFGGDLVEDIFGNG
jgi:Flp pilus assembly protein CpaB